jgi:hypothetical protein
MVPHGVSVIPQRTGDVRFTASANPARHLEAAGRSAPTWAPCAQEDAGKILTHRITWFMQRLKVANGCARWVTTHPHPALVEEARCRGTGSQEALPGRQDPSWPASSKLDDRLVTVAHA